MIEDVLRRIDERLKVVRLTESAAAKRAGLSADAIRNIRRAVKNGNLGVGLSTRTLIKLAPVLQSTPEWILEGSGESEDSWSSVPVMGYVGAGAEVNPEFEQVPPEGLDQIEVPFRLPAEMVAFAVRGESMLPVFKPGAIIIVYKDQTKPIESFYGHEAAVRTTDGRRYIKTIMRGETGVNLISWNAVPIENVRLDWIGEIFATLSPAVIRRIATQNGSQQDLKTA